MRAIMAVTLVAFLAVPVAADWEDGMPAKWVQMPDLSTLGIDVNTSMEYILADDFLCTEEGLITGIHLWGSWHYDQIPYGQDPREVKFVLSIHADIPADESPTGYSMPGEVLWYETFDSEQFAVRIWQGDIVEGWMDPPESYEFPGDWTCWQYNFTIDPATAFLQEGTPENPVVYWLDVKAIPNDQETRFGWKTSIDHWNDNAVWAVGDEPYSGPWEELVYPPGHELVGQPIDLAFVIEGEEGPDIYDFGDAPDPTYPTLISSCGAAHTVVPGVMLGASIDLESDGQQDPNALGDDNDGTDDEDGISFVTPLIPGYTTHYNVTASVPGYLTAWIDFDGDGTWTSGAEEVASTLSIPAGTSGQSFAVPASAVPGQTFARFRFQTASYSLTPTGAVSDGEVEDYAVDIAAGIDFGDAPDPPYLTLASSCGANHVIIPGVMLGSSIDDDADGQPDPNALGDDNDGTDDEDGIVFGTPLVPGQTAQYDVTASVAGYLDAWIDFDGDGTMAMTGAEHVATVQSIGAGTTTLSFPVPNDAVSGQTFARFRFQTASTGLSPQASAPDGEVEDYEVFIEEREPFKWLQNPDLNWSGIDVNATAPFVLADDWLCTEPGRIDEIHVWGSWLGDVLPFTQDPAAVDFVLSIHADIPADANPDGYSMPGELLWMQSFPGGSFDVVPYAENIEEGWLDPPDLYTFPADWTCWEYTFAVPPGEAFHQTGTPDSGVVYWLDVQAFPQDPVAFFGWKTSLDHWNDDAVWGSGDEPYPGPWDELLYPPGHQLFGESIDLAFMLRSHYGTGIGEKGFDRFHLEQNVPNPFNPVTTIAYQVPSGGADVRIEIYDVSGRLVKTLVDEHRPAGRHEVSWVGRDASGDEVASGVYFCRMNAGGEKMTRKMLLLK
ncbi:MAG: T9SS type A sorting domain-containing protein [Candidatus Eisenbacteria bacterium]|nr:T9SS type A sorting domain-containing protein [Candidatus Eisenbacteria bacterium]